MAIKFMKEKPLSEIRGKEELEKINIQADVFEVVAMLYEEMEGLRNKVVDLENRVGISEGGGK